MPSRYRCSRLGSRPKRSVRATSEGATQLLPLATLIQVVTNSIRMPIDRQTAAAARRARPVPLEGRRGPRPPEVMTLDVDAFLRRFLLHVVPRGFMRIRHFGLLANRTRRGLVRQCRDLLGHPPPADAAPESAAVLLPLAPWLHPRCLRFAGGVIRRCGAEVRVSTQVLTRRQIHSSRLAWAGAPPENP